MQFSNHRSRAARGSIVYLAVDAIAPSAVQPRQNFSPAQLEELSRSIAEYGVLSPLTVRPRQGGYELVAGERRLRAARMAGLSEVPCIILELDLEEASFIALVENLQRNDLDFLEEARGIAQLIRLFGLSQEECARRLGKSQSAVANKLRLLRLPEDVLNAMRNAGLTERHGRALLRLETPAEQREAPAYILSRDLNVAAAEDFHPQGRARVSQHDLAQSRPHEAGRHRRRHAPAGDGRGAHPDHQHSQGAAQRAGTETGRARAGRVKKSRAALDSGAAASYTLT